MNKLCITVSRIKNDGTLEYNEKLGAEQNYLIYEAMSEIVIHSAKHFIKEDFEVHVIRDEVSSYQEIFDNNFSTVYYDVWNPDEPNNVLYMDTDTLVVNPVSIFGQFDQFQMFNYTARRSLPADTNKYGLSFLHYFNAGIRYYPASMTEDTWDEGWQYAGDWDYNFWGTEQAIFNAMMYSQNPDYKHWLRPELGYQVIGIPYDKLKEAEAQMNQWNAFPFPEAKMLHLHGTRDAVNTLATQWLLWKEKTGEEFEFSRFDVVENNGAVSFNKK